MNCPSHILNDLPDTFADVELRLYAGHIPVSATAPLHLAVPRVTRWREVVAILAIAKLAILRIIHPEWFGDGAYDDEWRPSHPDVEHLERLARIEREPRHRLLASLIWDRRRQLYVGKAAAGTPTFLRVFDQQGRELVQYTPAGSHEFPIATQDGQDVAMEFHFTAALG